MDANLIKFRKNYCCQTIMPPKNRTKKLLGSRMGRPFRTYREAGVQTDAELGTILDSVSAIRAGESAVNERGKGDSAVLLRRQNILMIQLRKVSKQNQELKATISKYQQIPNLLQAIKVHYESTFCNIKDDMATLVIEQQNRETKLMDHLKNQKSSIERLIAIKDEKYKVKDEKNKALKAEKKLLNENIGLLQEALELEQRRVQVAIKEQCNAFDEAQEIRQRMDDKLFLAANQRCSTCQTRERVQDELASQIADQLRQMDQLRCLLQEREDGIARQNRINQMLINELEKKRGELKDKSFAANSYQTELANQQWKLRQAHAEIQQLRATAPNGHMVNEQQLNPQILTPPEEETGNVPKCDAVFTRTTTTTNRRNEQQKQQLDKKKAPILMKKAVIRSSSNKNEGCKKTGAEEELTVPVFVAKRRRIMQPTSDARDGAAMFSKDNNNAASGMKGHCSAHATIASNTDNVERKSDDSATERGAPSNRRQLTKVNEHFSPPSLQGKDSNGDSGHSLPQQPKNRVTQRQGDIASKSWRPTAENKQLPQKPPQSFGIQVHNQQQQQHLCHNLPARPTSTKMTTSSQPSFFFPSNNSTNFSSGNNTKGRTPPLPVVDGGDATKTGTWRKSMPGTFLMNRPADVHRDGLGNQQHMRERIEQEIRVAIAPSHSSGFFINSAASLPPMYACQQKSFPPSRPSAPIPRPPMRTVAQRANYNSVVNSIQPRPFKANGHGTLPWHAQTSGTFPSMTSQRPQAPQFFNR